MAISECDSCGSMLPYPDLEGMVTCLSCGREAHIDPDRILIEEEVLVAPHVAKITVPRASTGAQRGCGLATVVLISGGVVAALVALWAVSQVGNDGGGSGASKSTANLIVFGGSAHLIPDAQGGSQVLVTVQDISASQTERSLALVRFGSDEAELVWQSEPIEASASVIQVAVGDDALYVGMEDEARSIDPATGVTRWSATMTDTVTLGCADCFVVIDERLVVRTADAYVTGYGTGSNEPQWSRRLRSPAGSMSPVGDRLIIVDDPLEVGQTTKPNSSTPEPARFSFDLLPPVPAATASRGI